ncbi:MAG: ROK family protein [Pseudomonadota bacterium]|nr:ROK family protein [Pseudomonadota bacterium]
MSAAAVIAVDIGGTQVRVALFKDDRLQQRAALPTDVTGGPSGVMDQIDALIEQMVAKDDRKTITGIGLSLAGPIDTESAVVTRIPTLPGWDGLPVAQALSERTGFPARVENDGIAATLGEWRYGAGRGVSNIVYLTVSTGIGGGAVVDGRLLHGRKGIAGHLGHMRMAQEGPTCPCGTVGCFEALASGSALTERAVSTADKSDHLAGIAQSRAIDARDVFEGARADDSHCLDLVAEEARYLGQGITSVIHIFSPDRVVMGGGLSKAFDQLKPGIHEIISRDAMPPFRSVPVVKSALGDDSGLFGAASLVLDASGA